MRNQLIEQSEPIKTINISDADLAKFWGADLAKLTSYQKALIAKLFQAVQQRRHQ